MSELIFKKGLQEALPNIESRNPDAFYVVLDAKKMHLGDITWEDTESVKEEIKQIIADNEVTIAAALTELKETKMDVTAHNESINTLTENFNEELENVQTTIEAVSDNLSTLSGSVNTIDSLLESTNQDIDSVSGAVTSLRDEVLKNERTVAEALTELNENKLDASAYTEITDYVSTDDLATTLNDYAKKSDFEATSRQIETIQGQISSINTSIEGIESEIAIIDGDLDALSGHVLDNEVTIAAALSELKENKLDASAYTEITDYVNQETWNNHINDTNAQFTSINNSLSGKVNTANVKTLSGISLVGEGENIQVKTINNQSIFGEGNIAIDLSLFKVVGELPIENIDSTKIYVVPSATSGESNIYSEYVFLNGSWEKIGEYNSTISLEGYATEVWVGEQGYALTTDVEELSGHVLDNEVTIAAALTKLQENKLDTSAYTESIASYVTSESLTETLNSYATVESLDSLNESKLDVSAYTEITDYVNTTTFEGLVSNVEELSASVLDNEVVIAAALTDLNDRKLDVSAYTESIASYVTSESLTETLNNYATVENVNNTIEELQSNLQTSFDNIKDTTDTLRTDIDTVSGDIETEIVNREAAISGLTEEIIKNEKTIAAALTKLNEGKLDLSAYTENIGNFVTSSNLTSILEDYVTDESLANSSYATEDMVSEVENDLEALSGHVLDNETTIAATLTELKENKLDVSAYTEITDYVNTTTFDTTIETISNSIEQIDGQIDELSGNVLDNEVVIAAALTDLNDRKLDASAYTEITDYVTSADLEEVGADITTLYNALEEEKITRAEAISGLTDELIEDELAIAAALTELHETKVDESAFTEAISSLTQSIIDNEEITAQAIADLTETKVDKFDLPTFDNFATKEDLNNVSVDLSGYATKEDLENVSVDLSGYVTLETYNAKVSELTTKITALEQTVATLSAEVEMLDENKVNITDGAETIQIKDVDGLFASSTIEGALKELYDMIQTLQNNA